MLGSLFKAAVGVVSLPVAAVVDVAEVVGDVAGIKQTSNQNHTGNTLQSVVQNLQRASDGK